MTAKTVAANLLEDDDVDVGHFVKGIVPERPTEAQIEDTLRNRGFVTAEDGPIFSADRTSRKWMYREQTTKNVWTLHSTGYGWKMCCEFHGEWVPRGYASRCLTSTGDLKHVLAFFDKEHRP